MKSLLTVAICLLMSNVLLAQEPNDLVQEAISAGISIHEGKADATDGKQHMAYINFAADNVFRIYPYSKMNGNALPASELTHKQTGEAIAESDLENFNPLFWNIKLEKDRPIMYSIGSQTLMLLSEERLNTLWERHEINRRAAEKRSEK